MAILEHYTSSCCLKRSHTLPRWLSALNGWTWRDWVFLWRDIRHGSENKITLLANTCSFSKLRNITEAKTQARLCRISPPLTPFAYTFAVKHLKQFLARMHHLLVIYMKGNHQNFHEGELWTECPLQNPSELHLLLFGIACHNMRATNRTRYHLWEPNSVFSGFMTGKPSSTGSADCSPHSET